MKSPKSLYSRLALITSVTIVVGYFVVYAWTTIDPSRYAGGATLTSTLMTDIMANMTDLNTRVSNFSFNSGNVGIGTGSPTGNLHVFGTSNGILRIQKGSESYTTALSLMNSTTDKWSIAIHPNEDKLRFAADGDTTNKTRMTIDNAGNVGIGTTNPGAKLDVFTGTDGNVAYFHGSSSTGLRATVLTYQTFGYASFYAYDDGAAAYKDVYLGYQYSNPGIAIKGTNGNVGIGTTNPDAILDVVGTAHANSWAAHSDARLKKGIQTLTGALDKIYSINGVSYYWKEKNMIGKEFPDNKQIGVIAQEIEKVYPEVVETSKINGYKTVDYGKITPILIEAIKELKSQKNAEIVELKSQILELKNEIQELKNK